MERWSFRESPIVEMDERQLWAVGEWDKDINNCLRKTNLKDCNTWEGKGPEMIMGYKIDNAAF